MKTIIINFAINLSINLKLAFYTKWPQTVSKELSDLLNNLPLSRKGGFFNRYKGGGGGGNC